MSATAAPRPLAQSVLAESRNEAFDQIARGLQVMLEGIQMLGDVLRDEVAQVRTPQMMTLEDAAQRLACSYQHVWQKCRTGKIKAMHDGNCWRIAEADLEAYRRRWTK